MRIIHAVNVAAICAVMGGCATTATSGTSSAKDTSSMAAAQIGKMPPALGAIREADLKRDLYFFAGDTMRGREAGTLDELRAAMWLADRAREAGLEPGGNDGTYFQWWPMRRLREADNSRITIGDTPVLLHRDAVVFTPVDVSVDAPLMFVEPGTTVNADDVRGKAVATELPAPDRSAESPRRYEARALRQVSQKFLQMGAAAVIIASDSISDTDGFGTSGDRMIRGRYGVDTAETTVYWPDPRGGPRRAPPHPPVIWVRRALLKQMRIPHQRFTAQLATESFLYPSVNVIGVVRGTDPRLRDEYVEYSGHIDHDGVRSPIDGDSIWNGADDNGSVSMAMLAIARAFIKQPGQRSVIFVWHGAEERGLLGSRYFVMHPVVPKSAIVAVMNGDMIGRNNPDSATLLGSQPPHRNSRALVAMALAANDLVTKFALDTMWDKPTHPEGWYFRSDHLPYARAGIPAISFTTDLHKDYHMPSDEPSRIDYGKLTRMAQWMYATGWAVANAAQRPGVDPGFKLER